MIVYGDMGRKGGAPSLRRLKLEAKSRKYDAFLHVGDFAYNMNDERGLVTHFIFSRCIFRLFNIFHIIITNTCSLL